MKKTYTKTRLQMGTIVTIKVVTSLNQPVAEQKINQAFQAISAVETTCSRFNEQSELSKLSSTVNEAVHTSDLLFEAVRFSLEVAKLTTGLFDPTIGHTLETYGFNTNYLTGETVSTHNSPSNISYLDVLLDEQNRTILLTKPLTLDLGAIAKGLAVDLAAKELSEFEGYYIDAGGDLFIGGTNELDEPWTIGIQDPFHKDKTICSLQLSNAAICTSGSYERLSHVRPNTHHLIDPHTGDSPHDIVSCTVVAPFTMLADAFSTVAFLQGSQGTKLLEDVNLDGMWITSTKEMILTKGMKEHIL
ncbi:FAD:protein FMN transferase [Ectobacillus sp. sgz5001026]|uniref:FAD:protein FMN transferase n=1 Tax=Ectobacillus sp. sgz5001026 TaxID=3242473 RepID=UPI0036D35F03